MKNSTTATQFNVQNFVGTYKSIEGNSTLTFNKVTETTVDVTIKNLKIPGRPAYSIMSMDLRGVYKPKDRRPNSKELVYFLTLSGVGLVNGPNNSQFTAALTLSAYSTSLNPMLMTSQFAVAYEFAGNSEAVDGGLTHWVKN